MAEVLAAITIPEINIATWMEIFRICVEGRLGDVGILNKNLWWSVKVPPELVTDGTLSLAARFLYMVLASLRGQDEVFCISQRQLARISGIAARASLRRYLQELVISGWVTVSKGSKGPGPRKSCYRFAVRVDSTAAGIPIGVPASVIYDHHLSPAAKCLYAFISLHSYRAGSGFGKNQSELAKAIGVSRNTVSTLVRRLKEAGWLEYSRSLGSRSPQVFGYRPLDPHLSARELELDRVKHRLGRERFKGEALMKEMLNVVVADDRFQDNARPGYLVNPLTDERMEFDRLYLDTKVAFEFNGPQHYSTSDVYPDSESVRQQKARDLMKAAIAGQRGIQLVIVRPHDLVFPRLMALIPKALPVRQIKLEDPVVRYLDKYSRAYVRRAMMG